METQNQLSPELSQVLASYEANRRHTARAAAALLPGALLRAFAVGIRPGGLRSPCLGDFALLAGWEHPLAGFVESWLAGEAAVVPVMTTQDLDRVSCLWRVPWERALESATGQGLSAFRGCARDLMLTAEQACGHAISAFATGVRMAPEARDGSVVVSSPDQDGLGWWLSLFGLATEVLRMSEAEALGYPIDRLIARRIWRDRVFNGMVFEGPSYIAQEEAARLARDEAKGGDV